MLLAASLLFVSFVISDLDSGWETTESSLLQVRVKITLGVDTQLINITIGIESSSGLEKQLGLRNQVDPSINCLSDSYWYWELKQIALSFPSSVSSTWSNNNTWFAWLSRGLKGVRPNTPVQRWLTVAPWRTLAPVPHVASTHRDVVRRRPLEQWFSKLKASDSLGGLIKIDCWAPPQEFLTQ